MKTDIDAAAAWANRRGFSLRFTFHPSPDSEVLPNGIWDLTVKPGLNGEDHTHFLGRDLPTAIGQMANDYKLPDEGFSADVREARLYFAEARF